MGRCYRGGIPDQVPTKLMQSNRAPSWRAVAVAILRNDHKLHGLGFSDAEPETVIRLFRERREAELGQEKLL